MSQVRAKILVLLFLLFYFLAGLLASRAPGGEAYPFFSWFLFTKVPSPVETEYGIRFLEREGKELDPPVLFEEAPSFYSQIMHSNTEYLSIIQLMGEGMAQYNEKRVERYRSALEKSFTSYPVTYELISVRFNPIARWKDGTVLDVTPLRTFTSRETP